MNMTHSTKKWLGAAALVLSSSVLTGAVMRHGLSQQDEALSQVSYFGAQPTAMQMPNAASASLAAPAGLVDLTAAAERSVNSVVYIKVTKNAKRQMVTVRDPFEDFFGDFFGRGRGQGRQQEIETQPKQQGAGSGVIISEDGVIITNYHVIEGASTVTVRAADGKSYSATVTGGDSQADIALLKIDATGLSAATLGNSSALVVGQEVIAIGNPLGSLGGTVTNGIISALDREIQIDGETMNLLQTNAAVNPGNSGGGLFNLGGELIGIVNAKSTGSNVEGLGFAIPINDAVEVMKELSEYGYVRGRVYLGITYYEVDSSSIFSNPFSAYSTPGVYVRTSELNPELKSGDRIVSVDGHEVSSAAGIKAALHGHKVGDQLKVTVVRSGRTVDVTVTLYEKTPASAQSGT